MVQSDRARGTTRTRFLLQGILTCKILTAYEPNSYLYYIADALFGGISVLDVLSVFN